MAEVRIGIAPEPEWIGRGVTWHQGGSGELAEALVEVQRGVVAWFEQAGGIPDDFRVYWEVVVGGQNFEWNPQVGVPAGATELVCVGTGGEGHE